MQKKAEISSVIKDKLNLFDNLEKAVLLVDKQFNIHSYNNSFSNIYTSEEDSLKGKPFLPFICPDDWESCHTQMLELLSGEKKVVKTEKRFKSSSGDFVWSNIIATVWKPNDNDTFIFVLFDDVSALKSTQKMLANSEVKYSGLIENLPVAVFHVDLKDLEPKVYFSRQFENIFHISPVDFDGSFIGLRKYIHREDLAKFNHSHSDILAEKNLVTVEFRLINDSGKIFWVRELAELIRADNNKVVQIFGVMMDITSEVQTQKQLWKTELKHHTLIESANDRIGVLDIDGNLIYGNSHFFNALGIGQQEYFSSSLIDFFHPDDQNKHADAIEEVKEKGQALYEYRIMHKNGHYLYMSNKLTLIKDEKGEVEGILSINRDITRLKKIEKELIKARRKAEESDRLKSAFLANMSHEIRTPLNGIIGFSKLLSGSNVIAQKRKMYSNIIERNSQQLLSLISDIIDISKIESDQLKIHSEQVNVNDLLDEIYQIFDKELESHSNKEVTLHLSKDLKRDDSNFVTDRFRLAQLYNNLLSNALKFTSTGSIEFGYRHSGKDFLFFVKDTGSGILSENQEIIFEPFRQEDDTITRKYGGTGLGLAICKKLVHLMGGKIWVESEKGKGSVFYFTLKISNGSVKQTEKLSESIDVKAKWPGKTILVVDDNKDVLTYMGEVLSDCQAKIILAESGEEAIDICNWAEKVDLMLLDIQMPGMDGYTTACEILKLHPDLPIIAQTAHAMSGDEKKCICVGCSAYISKPIDKQKLQQLISTFLN